MFQKQLQQFIPGPQSLERPVTANLRAALADGAGVYVGGRFIQPQLVTGWYRNDSDGTYTFELSGSPDVVSVPGDSFDLGRELYEALTALHGGSLYDPWTSTLIVQVGPETGYDQLNLILGDPFHPQYIGLQRIRLYDLAGQLYEHDMGDTALPQFTVNGVGYHASTTEVADSSPEHNTGLGKDHVVSPGDLVRNFSGGGFGNGVENTVSRIEFVADPEIAPGRIQVENSNGGWSNLLTIRATQQEWQNNGGVLSVRVAK